MTNQTPTFFLNCEFNKTDGSLCSEYVKQYGLILDPWQKWIANILLSEKTQVAFSVPRQNGKNAIVEAVEFFCAAVLGETIVHTAHEVKTSMSTFNRMNDRWFSNPLYKDLHKIVKISKSHGSESLMFEGGGKILFMARTALSGLGFSADKIVFDEAQELTTKEASALTSLMTATKHSSSSKMIFMGTPPKSDREGSGEVFQRIRAEAYKGMLNKKHAYIEWGVPGIDKKNLKDRATWIRVNPAWKYRINEDSFDADAVILDLESFHREHLGYWAINRNKFCFTKTQLGKKITRRWRRCDNFTLGLSFSDDGGRACLAITKRLGEKMQCELIGDFKIPESIANMNILIRHLTSVKGYSGMFIAGRATGFNWLTQNQNRTYQIARAQDENSANAKFDELMKTENFYLVKSLTLEKSLLSLEKSLKAGGWNYISRQFNLSPAKANIMAAYALSNNLAIKDEGTIVI